MKLSLAGWSLQKLFRASENPLTQVDFPAFTKEHFGLDAVELLSRFFISRESSYLREMVNAADRAGVKLLNIACDTQGDLSSSDESLRQLGVTEYSEWVVIAGEIGCGAIRANSGGKAMADKHLAEERCTQSFKQLADVGKKHGVAILMENHWGLSADPDSIYRIISAVRQSHGDDAVGTMPDFGNWPEETDRYEALRKIMPFAKAVHAKVNDIDENLNHPRFDHARCIQIAKDAGYDGYLGIEYEGSGEPVEGVKRSVRKLRPLIG